MTQEEKLEEAKRLYETANADQRYVLESLFPELKESEDEGICRKLIAFLRQCRAVYGDGFKQFGLDIDDALAWLEKQGEQKITWSEEDEEKMNWILATLNNSSMRNSESLPMNESCEDWLKSIRPKFTWKPSDEQMRVLDLAIRCGINRGTTEETTLVSLFNDLKKLK